MDIIGREVYDVKRNLSVVMFQVAQFLKAFHEDWHSFA